MGSYKLNLVNGSMYAVFDEKTFKKDESIVLGLYWQSEDFVDNYYVTTTGTTSKITSEEPEEMVDQSYRTIPIYARREIFRTFTRYNGFSPRNPNRPLSMGDVQSIIEYFERVIFGWDLSDLKLYGTVLVSKSPRMAIGDDGLIGSQFDKTPGGNYDFIHQRRPRDHSNRYFSKGAIVKYDTNGQQKQGQVMTMYKDVVIVDDYAVGEGKGQSHIAAEDITIYRSKERKLTSYTHKVPKSTLSSYLMSNKKNILECAQTGGLTLLLENGYSVDAAAQETASSLMYQLYAPTGISLGIYTRHGEQYFEDIFDADLTSKTFANW